MSEMTFCPACNGCGGFRPTTTAERSRWGSKVPCDRCHGSKYVELDMTNRCPTCTSADRARRPIIVTGTRPMDPPFMGERAITAPCQDAFHAASVSKDS